MMRSPSYAVFVIGFFMLFCSVAVPEATATLLDRNLNNFNNDNNMGSLRHERLHSAVRSSLIRWDHILSGPYPGDGGHNLFVGDSDDATVKCVNGGVLPPDAEGNSEARCICPLSYTGQTCSERQCPNSIDGEGPFGIRPVNPENQLCDQCHRDMFDGINCQLCKQNAACNSYTGKGSRCDTGFAIQGNEKQFQCSLDAPYFINLMGDGRNITSDIMLNWTTTDGKAFGTHDNGLCHMAIYRREPEDSYLDPFFRCDASECSYHFDEEEGHANTNNTSARETRVQVFFRFVRLAGQVVLMLLCLALTVLSCFSSSLGPKRMKKLTIYISAALVLITLLYIFAMVISVRPAHAAQTVVFQCKHTRCACAEDPPEQFQPICSHSPVLNEAILPSIRNSIRLICSVETKRCSLNLDDLNLVFDSTCEASECVDEDVFPDRSGSTHTKGDTRRLTILRFLVYLVSATGVGVAVHALILYLQSRRRRKEFTKIFHLLDLRRAAATAGDGGAGTTTMETAMLLPPTAATRVLPPLEEEEEFAGDECTNSHPPHHDQEEGQGHPSNNSLVHVVTVDRDGSEARSSSHRGGSRARPGETAAVASETGVAAPTTIVITAQGGGGGGGGGEEEEDEEGGGEETDPLLPSVSSPPRPPVTGGDELEVTSVLSDHTRASVEALRRDCRSILCLEAHGLRYTLPVSRFAEETETRQILQNINFTVNSGDVVAIMGPSGAGKSTLLDLISTRGKSGEVGGELRVNDTCITSNQRSTTTTSNGAASSNVSPGTLKRQYRNLIGYVSQDDTLLPTLTVRQTITYAARLKLPSVFSPVMIKDIVSLTIRALKLERCADTLIGDGSSLRGVSGGERRRVSIAVELLANPRILLLDEPTSGLDSVSAKTVMEAIATVAKDSPMRVYAPYYFAFKPIVLFSIHQPSIDIYNLFDKVLLLSQGWSVYSGTAGDAAPVLLHRINEAFGYARCDPESFRGQNPAEFLLKLEDQMDDAVRQRLQQYNTSDHHRRPLWAARRENTPITLEENTARAPAAAGGGGLTQHISGEVDDAGTLWRGSTGSSGGSHSGMGVMVSGERLLSTTAALRRFYANVYQQLDILISRSCACLLGSFSLIACHAGVVACLSVLLCTVYQSQGLDLPGALNRAGCITFLLLVTSFMSLSCLEALIVERRLFLEERENGFYSTFPYLVSKLVVDILPFRAVPAMVLGSIIYFPMGFRADQGWSFFYFISILVLFSVDITLLTLCIGIVSSAFGSAALLSSVMILLNFVFGGAMVQAGTLPPFLQGIQRLSPFFLAFEALMVNELDGQACTFSPTDETGKPSASFPIMCRQYLANEGLQPSRWSEDIIQLCLYSVFLLVFACILMSYWTKLVR